MGKWRKEREKIRRESVAYIKKTREQLRLAIRHYRQHRDTEHLFMTCLVLGRQGCSHFWRLLQAFIPFRAPPQTNTRRDDSSSLAMRLEEMKRQSRFSRNLH